MEHTPGLETSPPGSDTLEVEGGASHLRSAASGRSEGWSAPLRRAEHVRDGRFQRAVGVHEVFTLLDGEPGARDARERVAVDVAAVRHAGVERRGEALQHAQRAPLGDDVLEESQLAAGSSILAGIEAAAARRRDTRRPTPA